MEEKHPRLISFFLCLFFGNLGLHRFYLGKMKSGLVMLLTLGGLGVWYLVDLVLISTGTLKRKAQKTLSPFNMTLRNKQ